MSCSACAWRISCSRLGHGVRSSFFFLRLAKGGQGRGGMLSFVLPGLCQAARPLALSRERERGHCGDGPIHPKLGLSASCMSFLHPVSFHSVPFFPSAPLAGGGTLIRAFPARARARVGAGAVRAPECPRARQMQGAPRLSAESGSFRMRAGTGGEAASRMPLPCSDPILPQVSQKSNHILELIQKL